jgi:hypothetical protein
MGYTFSPPHIFITWCVVKNGHAGGEERSELPFLSARNLNDKLKMQFEVFAVVKISYGLVVYTTV